MHPPLHNEETIKDYIERREEKELRDCVKYCRIQNGREDCKNCGLDDNMITFALDEASEIAVNEYKERVGLLRQWLNEDRITDPKKMVTNEDILHWLSPKLIKENLIEKAVKEVGERYGRAIKRLAD